MQSRADPHRSHEQAHHDRRHSGHHVAHEPDDARKGLLTAVLVQIDGGEHAERNRNHGSDAGDQQRSHDGGPHSATRKLRDDRDVLGEERPVDDLDAFVDDIARDEPEGEQRHQDGADHPRPREPVRDPPPRRDGAFEDPFPGVAGRFGRSGGRHARTTALYAPAVRFVTNRASMLIAIVSANSTTPRPMSADR